MPAKYHSMDRTTRYTVTDTHHKEQRSNGKCEHKHSLVDTQQKKKIVYLAINRWKYTKPPNRLWWYRVFEKWPCWIVNSVESDTNHSLLFVKFKIRLKTSNPQKKLNKNTTEIQMDVSSLHLSRLFNDYHCFRFRCWYFHIGVFACLFKFCRSPSLLAINTSSFA